MVDPPPVLLCETSEGYAPTIDQGTGMTAADYGHCICLSAHIENLYGTKREVGELEVRCRAVPENASCILN